MVLLQGVHSLKIHQHTKFLGPTLVKVLHPHQKFQQLFWSSYCYGIEKYDAKVNFNDMTYLLNFMKIYQLIKTLLGDVQTDRQHGDLTSLTFLCEASSVTNITGI
jgi:hypothetical protein